MLAARIGPVPLQWTAYLYAILLTTIVPQAFADKGDGIIDPGENETAELARSAQNPVADMISLPFQNNTDFNFGPQNETLNTLNIQPVLPFELNDKWNLITRTIIPVVSQPGIVPGRTVKPGWETRPSPRSFPRSTRGSGSGASAPWC